ncbi:MAG TPA: hypothetical protein VKF59_21205 [Candidatus Dormibacteraeota bacterium]|nr:hypothetical protein [Candidatus Dormibacteraeota bacterium]
MVRSATTRPQDRPTYELPGGASPRQYKDTKRNATLAFDRWVARYRDRLTGWDLMAITTRYRVGRDGRLEQDQP